MNPVCLMITLFLALILVCTISPLPFLVTQQYTQPLPLLLNFLLILYALRLFPLSLKPIANVVGGCILIIVLSQIYHPRFDPIISSYVVSAFLFALGCHLALNYSRVEPRYTVILLKATALIPALVLASIMFDYLFPGVLDLFKSNPSLSNEFLLLRSKSGILPEPSFVGPVCSLSYLFLTCQILLLERYSHFEPNFLNFRISCLVCALIAITISVSVASVISSIGFFTISFFLGGELRLLTIIAFRLPRTFLLRRAHMYALLSIILLTILLVLLITSRSSSRISYLGDLLLSGRFTFNQDESVVDRSLSSIFGLTTVFVSPLGFGLNGFTAAAVSCQNNILVRLLDINCSIAMSSRNHNLIANYLQDFGVFGLLYILYCGKLLRLELRKVHLLIAGFLLVGLLTPNSLASPLFWYTFAFLSFLPRVIY
jgi:hypothetical protein